MSSMYDDAQVKCLEEANLSEDGPRSLGQAPSSHYSGDRFVIGAICLYQGSKPHFDHRRTASLM